MSEEQNAGPIRITIEKAKELVGHHKAIILDVVDTDTNNELAYKIEGAVRIDPEDFADEYTQLPKDRPILAY